MGGERSGESPQADSQSGRIVRSTGVLMADPQALADAVSELAAIWRPVV